MLLLMTSLALATDPVDLGVLKNSDIQVVQRRLYSQEDRLELGAHLSFLPFDLLTVTPQLMLTGAYHFTEGAAIEAHLGGGYGFKTAFFDALGVDGSLPEAYRYLANGDASFVWTPVYGKINLMGKHILHTDVYLSVGAGATLEQSLLPSDNKANGDGKDPAAYLMTVAPTIPLGIGTHLFLGPSTALRFELRDNLLIEHRIQTDTTWFRQSLGVSGGFVFYGKKKG